MAQTTEADSLYRVRINLISVCSGLTSAFIVQTMLLIIIPLTALERGASPLMVGIILSAPHLLPMVLAIPLAGVINRSGGKRAILAGSLGMMLGAWTVLLLPGFTGLILAQLMVGIAHMVMILAGQTIISELGQGKALERYFGWYTTSLSAGQLVGPLLAGWLIDISGLAPTLIVTGVIAFLGLLSGWFLTDNASIGQATGRSLVGYRAQLTLLRTNSGVQVSIFLTVAVVFALGAHGTFVPVYLASLDMSATIIGALVSLRAICAMVVRPFMPQVIEWLGGRSRAMLVSVSLVAAGLMFTGLAEGVVQLGLLALLIGIGSGISQPLSMVVMAERVPHAQRSGALAMRLMGNRSVQFLAPLSLGLLAEIAPYNITFLFGGAIVLVLASLMALRLPAFEESNERPRQD